jgi:membrane associated rhomboid family serine protease
MLILADESSDRRTLPWLTFLLIGLNMLCFAAQVSLGRDFTFDFALVPSRVTTVAPLHGSDRSSPAIVNGGGRGSPYYRSLTSKTPLLACVTPITYAFLHGSFWHILFNMWYLAIFGRNVECALGPGRFFAFYLACGLLAGIAQVVVDSTSSIPIVGASGGIAGVMGAYFAIFPLNKVKVLLFIVVVDLPAFVVVGFWFLMQYIGGMSTLDKHQVGGVAYWCHIGGFVAGFCLIRVIVLALQFQARFTATASERPASRGPRFDAARDYHQARAAVFRDVSK